MLAASQRKKRVVRKKKSKDILHFQVKRGHFYAALVALAFFLGIAVGYLNWGRAQETLASGPPGQSTTQRDIASELKNLPRYEVPISVDDPARGPEDAPITIIEFADFECPFCQRHAQQVFPRLLEEFGDQARFVYKDFPLSNLHPNAFPAALSAQCAQEQDAFWPYHDLLLSGRLELGRESYETYARQLGLETENFVNCLEEGRYAENVQADYDLGVQLGVASTPTFFINGIAVVGAQPYDLFAQIIQYELGAE